MQYARLGNSGLLVSKLAFGAMTFGSGEGRFAAVAKVDQRGANELTGIALDSGVNFFNTADMYAGGQSEEMLGKALGARRKDVVIASKVGFRSGEAMIHAGLSRAHIFESIEGSLRRLATDYLDVYLVHRLDPYTPVEETLDALNDLVRQGKIRYIGFSNWPAWLAAKSVGLQRAHGWSEFRSAEMYYSLVGREIEHEIVPFALDAGVGIVVWSPLASGFLSGKYTRQNPQGDGGRLSGFDILPMDRDRAYAIVDKLEEIGTAHAAAPAEVAIAWLLSRPGVNSILVGASNAAQLRQNLKAADIALSAGELRALDEISRIAPIYPNWFNANIVDEQAKAALEGKPPTARSASA